MPPLDARPANPYLHLMGRKNASRLRSIACALLSAFVILCLIIAPLCASRCAAQTCAFGSQDGTAVGCHQSAETGSGATLNIARESPCVSSEIVFTAPRSELRVVSEKSPAASTLISPFALNPSVFSNSLAKGNADAFGASFSPGAVL